jgi:hypothetical protein
MIRYDFDPVTVERDIRNVDPNWFKKAEARKLKFKLLHRYEEKSSIWSKAKPAFMRLQMSKCAFCERQFENPDYGKIEFDVEHFRPKSSVAAWPDPVRHPGLRYTFSTGGANARGYYWLAYELQNYAASCKVCNTALKLNFFPIAGKRGRLQATLSALARERPFLCYPIGNIDNDPEELVTFLTTTAVPAKASGHKRRRGQIIIDFFALNQREQLHRERARMIGLFGAALKAEARGTATAADTELIARMTLPLLPHAACLRAFKRLWAQDRVTAERAYDLCRVYATSDSGSAPPALSRSTARRMRR